MFPYLPSAQGSHTVGKWKLFPMEMKFNLNLQYIVALKQDTVKFTLFFVAFFVALSWFLAILYPFHALWTFCDLSPFCYSCPFGIQKKSLKKLQDKWLFVHLYPHQSLDVTSQKTDRRTDRRTDGHMGRWTDRRTFAMVESLLWLKSIQWA